MYSKVTSRNSVSPRASSVVWRRLLLASSTSWFAHQIIPAIKPIVASAVVVASRPLVLIFIASSLVNHRHAFGLHAEQCIEVKVRQHVRNRTIVDITPCHGPSCFVFESDKLQLAQVHLEYEIFPAGLQRLEVELELVGHERLRQLRLGSAELLRFQ